jgi:oligosaccharide repeat unit polymerase
VQNKGIARISPNSLMVVIWSVTLLLGLMPLAFPDSFTLVFLFIKRQKNLSLDDFTLIASLWQALMFAVFVIASWLTMMASPKEEKPFDTGTDFGRAARITFLMNVLFVTVTLMWVTVSALHMGGLRGMMLMVQLDPDYARDVLKENALFPGMRQFYGALPGTGAFAAGLLAAGTVTGRLPKRERIMMQVTVTLNLILLLLLPIVMSQRLLLLQMILAAYFSVCIIHRRFVAIPHITIGGLLFLTTWILREAVTNPSVNGTAIRIGLEKLVFYFTNDLLNAFMPLNRDIPHTLGFFSLSPVLAYTFTYDTMASVLSERLAIAGQARGGGAWSIFTMPYVDFGAIGGALFVALMAVLSTISFIRSTRNIFWAVVYGNVAAGLMLSTHLMHFAVPDFYGALFVVGAISFILKKV